MVEYRFAGATSAPSFAEIGRPDIVTNSELKGSRSGRREYLLANWSDDIRDRVMEIIKRNIEFEISL